MKWEQIVIVENNLHSIEIQDIQYPPFTMGIRNKRNMNILYSSESTTMRIVFIQKSKLEPNQEM